MSELRALLFDVDGTLADTERDGHRVAFNRAFQDAGLDWSWSVEDYGWLLQVTGGKERIRFFIEQRHPSIPEGIDVDQMIIDLHKSKTDHYTRLLGEGKIPLRPGVEQLLREALDSGLRISIATTTTPENVTALLENTIGTESIQWFDVIGAGDIVPHKKPAGDIYTYVMQEMGLFPDECLALEDSENGVLAAADAGIRAMIITTNGYTEDHDFNGATTVINRLCDADGSAPVKLLSGFDPESSCIDIAALRRVYAAAHASAGKLSV
jgi:beta-phosphoglucomutase-like phosphatase (HAD superfamily)